MEYPNSPKIPVADEYHGIQVMDVYRWLENAEDADVFAFLFDQLEIDYQG